jgi:hypothetical protein
VFDTPAVAVDRLGARCIASGSTTLPAARNNAVEPEPKDGFAIDPFELGDELLFGCGRAPNVGGNDG